MWRFVRSIPQKGEAPETMQFETSAQFGSDLLQQGKKIYTENCAKCHAENGLGKPPAYPPLATNQSIQMQSAVNPIRMVLNGGYPPSTDRQPHPHGMPPVAQTPSETEEAAGVTDTPMSGGEPRTPG